jgi:hypothetical protein
MADTNPPNHNERSLNPCNDKGFIPADLNVDKPTEYCEDDGSENLNRTAGRPDLGWLEDATQEIAGKGYAKNCDPMQSGKLFNDLENPDRNHIYRYNKSLRGCDEAVLDLFTGLHVLDINGKAHRVPIIWGSQERAVIAILGENVRQDNSLVVDRPRLPMMAIHDTGLELNTDKYVYHQALDWMRDFREDGKPGFTTNEKYERDTVFGVARGVPIKRTYTLYAWTKYLEDMNQIVTQILHKLTRLAYITVRGVPFESTVNLDSIANNLDTDTGNKDRIIKYQFNLTAETYIPQPIVRNKAVLKTRVNYFNDVDEENINEVIQRIETAVEELESD